MPRIVELKPQHMVCDIGMTIEGFRKRKGLKQSELAELSGIPQQNLSYKILNNSFKYEDLIKIFKALELTDEQILRLMKI